MKYLLDTPIFLWWIENSPSLPQSARAAIANPNADIFLSAASVWEIVTKHQLGKLFFPTPFEQTIPQILAHDRITLLPIDLPHLFKFHQLPNHHRDLFDRLLVAQALAESLTLITCNPTLHPYGVPLLQPA
ncbi:MAG: type II toxin-antitoxin system VapC family toxin [Phycisphaerae bacterium]